VLLAYPRVAAPDTSVFTPNILGGLLTGPGSFMKAAGFDEVTVDGDQFTIENSVG
jgi:hypothetical protein